MRMLQKKKVASTFARGKTKLLFWAGKREKSLQNFGRPRKKKVTSQLKKIWVETSCNLFDQKGLR